MSVHCLRVHTYHEGKTLFSIQLYTIQAKRNLNVDTSRAWVFASNNDENSTDSVEKFSVCLIACWVNDEIFFHGKERKKEMVDWGMFRSDGTASNGFRFRFFC